MPEWSQDGRSIGIETTLSSDYNFVLLSIEGESSISDTFSYQLKIASLKTDVKAKDIIGQKINVWFLDPNGTKYYINAYISRFAAGRMIESTGYRSYQLQIVPGLWFLNKTRNCKIFQNKTAASVISEVLDAYNDLSIALNIDYDIASKVSTENLRTLEYCVQYRESDLQFISRIAKENGLFFYFTHIENLHTLVFADSASGYHLPGASDFEVNQSVNGRIKNWDVDFEFISGDWTLGDFNFENNYSASTSHIIERNSPLNPSIVESPTALAFDQFKHYDYPAGYPDASDVEKQVNNLMDEEEAGYNVIHGTCDYRSISAGAKFKVIAHDFSDELNKVYVVTGNRIKAQENTYYTVSTPNTGSPNTNPNSGSGSGPNANANANANSNANPNPNVNLQAPPPPVIFESSFSAIPANVKFVTKVNISRPVIHGPQTAIVVGNADEKVHTNEYGSVRVQFHWDRLGASDSSSSCWLRVAQGWAGSGWGEMALPHVGHEVIVSFLDGNPDKPIVTGRVYNQTNMPPQVPTANTEKHILKDDFGNQIVMDATDGVEQVLIESPKNNASIEIGTILKSTTVSKSDITALNARLTAAEDKNAQQDSTNAAQDSANAAQQREIEAQGVRINTNGEMIQAIQGDLESVKSGNSYSINAGCDFSMFGGAKLDISGGIAGSLSAGVNYTVGVGGNYTFTAGFTNAFTTNAWINATNSDILNSASQDIILGAGDQLCFAANCKEAIPATDEKAAIKNSRRSIIYADGENLSLSIGDKFTTKVKNPAGAHKDWYAPYGALGGLSLQDVAVLAGSAVSSGLAAGAVAVAKSDNDGNNGATVGLSVGAGAAFLLTTALVLKEWYESNRDAAIEPIVHDDDQENMKILLNNTDGISIDSKIKKIDISFKKEDKGSNLHLDDKYIQMADIDDKSHIKITNDTGVIAISNKDSKSGQILINSKEDIFLNAGSGGKTVNIKSKSFIANNNLKVLS